MSTKERYGTEVWNALIALEDALPHDAWGWHSVGEVAEKAGVSRGTARKYLNALYEMQKVRSIGRAKTGYFYQPIR